MKYLQGYNNFIIKESLSEDELNQILDKISKKACLILLALRYS